jgi:serine-threonine kinase receptor-associated protein
MEIKPITNNSENQYMALSIAAGNIIFIYDVTDLNHIQLRVKHTLNKINFYNEGGISLHPTGTKFIVGGSDLYVYLYSITYHNGNEATVTELDCYKGHHGPIRCLRYSPNGTTFASGSEDGTIRLWQQPP